MDTLVGAIKLMVAANPACIGLADNQGQSLLHIVCQGGNLDVVNYLIGMEQDFLKVPDLRGNLPLHHACMRGNCDIIPPIIEQSLFGVTVQNSNKKSPIDLLLFESECDRDSIEYVETVRCLFQVNPEDTLNHLMGKDKRNTTDNGDEQNACMKRKRI